MTGINTLQTAEFFKVKAFKIREGSIPDKLPEIELSGQQGDYTGFVHIMLGDPEKSLAMIDNKTRGWVATIKVDSESIMKFKSLFLTLPENVVATVNYTLQHANNTDWKGHYKVLNFYVLLEKEGSKKDG